MELFITHPMAKEKIVVVRTDYEFKTLMKVLEHKGYRWQGGDLPTSWRPYGDEVIQPYSIHLGEQMTLTFSYHNSTHHNKNAYEIMSFDEYMGYKLKSSDVNLNQRLIQAIKSVLR